ncbi:sulfotransferase family 2 domain-containing protein [Mesobacterium pallidum]|uniref:sulfotransferase family 2 domain-containing protein n=1 Tax=Mesobacterium pallidum TaxID=2872037 RepID=UPI001EE19548|nr:sulfotransferase family 2 domain-containing protein [Mesobacterium pallidum]
MLYHEDALFIHVPKTAGMSVVRFLVNALDGPVTVFAPARAKEHTFSLPATDEARTKMRFVAGRRHGTCDAAMKEIEAAGLAPPACAFAIARDPVSLMVSYYKHMQKPAVWKWRGQSESKLSGAPRLAVEGTFDEFVRGADFYNMTDDEIADYYRPHGFARLDIVALDHLNNYLQHRFGHHAAFDLSKMEHRNTSRHIKEKVIVSDETRAFLAEKYPRLTATYAEALERGWQKF